MVYIHGIHGLQTKTERCPLLLSLMPTLLVACVLDNIDHERASQQDGRLTNIVMFIATMISLHLSPEIIQQKITPHLKVPTPPVSSSMAGPSSNLFPTHLIANARNICPCATSKTSGTIALPSDASTAGVWNRRRMSSINRSSRFVTSAGDLDMGGLALSSHTSYVHPDI